MEGDGISISSRRISSGSKEGRGIGADPGLFAVESEGREGKGKPKDNGLGTVEGRSERGMGGRKEGPGWEGSKIRRKRRQRTGSNVDRVTGCGRGTENEYKNTSQQTEEDVEYEGERTCYSDV